MTVFPGNDLLARYQLKATALGNANPVPRSVTFKDTNRTSKSLKKYSIADLLQSAGDNLDNAINQEVPWFYANLVNSNKAIFPKPVFGFPTSKER